MIVLHLEPDALATPNEIEQVIPVLVSKMKGDLPDRKDTATLAYVTLKAMLLKIKDAPGESVDMRVSNDAALALQNELRLTLAANEQSKSPYPFRSMVELQEQVTAHLAQVEKNNAERRAELVRRNPQTVRGRWPVRKRPEVANATARDDAGTTGA